MTPLPAEDLGYLLFELHQVNTLYHVAISLRQAGIICEAVISGHNEDWQMRVLHLDITQHFPSVGSVQKQIQKHQIRS